MPRCPHCKTEYPDGAPCCPGCGVLPSVEAPGYEEPVPLVTLPGIQADQVAAFLHSQGIAVYRKGADQPRAPYAVSGGSAAARVELFVPAALLQEAREALLALGSFQPPDAAPPPGEEPQEEIPLPDRLYARQVRQTVSWLLLVIFIFGTVMTAAGVIPYFIRLLGEMMGGTI